MSGNEKRALTPRLRFPEFRGTEGWVKRELGEFITERIQPAKKDVPLYSLTINLNISRYVSTAVAEEEINLEAVHGKLTSLDEKIKMATERHNEFLKELGLPLLP